MTDLGLSQTDAFGKNYAERFFKSSMPRGGRWKMTDVGKHYLIL